MTQRNTNAPEDKTPNPDPDDGAIIQIGRRRYTRAELRGKLDRDARLSDAALDWRLTVLEEMVAANEEVVRTRQLEVVDSKGNVRAVLGGADDHFGLTLRDSAGRGRVFLQFRDDEDGADPTLDFSNGDNIVASFGVIDAIGENQPSVHLDLHADSGDALVSLDVTEDDETGPRGLLRIGEYKGPNVDVSASVPEPASL